MEYSLWVKGEAGCKCKKLKKSQEEWQKKIAEIEKGLWFKQSSLIACNQQLHVSRGAAPASSSCYKFEIKIGSMVDLNHGLSCQTAR